MSFRALVEKSPATETRTPIHDYPKTLARGGSPHERERNENGRTRIKYLYRGGFLHCVRTIVLTSVEMTL